MLELIGGLLVLIAIGVVVLALLRIQLYTYVLRLTPPLYRVAAEHGVSVQMRDGVALATDHYYPLSKESFPTILIRSPYGRNRSARGFGLILDFFVRRFAERGYHVVVQDTRGRFDSGGEFDPYFNEQNDGLDTLEWIKQQQWFNGVLGMWGPSYLGIAQWTLAAASPMVKAMVPAITASKLQQILFPDGVLDLGLVVRWMAIFQALDRGKDAPLWTGVGLISGIERAIKPAFAALPLSEVDQKIVGAPMAYYRNWLDHTTPDDPLWRQMKHDMALAHIQAPVHLMGGWYDFFLRGLLADYAELKAAGKTPYLTVGPWFHFSNSMVMTDSLREGLNWFDVFLKEDRSRLREKPVRLYVMGAKQWRDFDEWPPPTKPTYYYLSGEHSLRLDSPGEGAATDHYCYDPADPTPAVGGTQFSLNGGPRSNRRLEARPDVITYTTAPLDTPLDVIGLVYLELYVGSSLDYTDFFGRLCDVYPNNESINICDGLYRIEPGKGTRQPDGSVCIEIDMWATAYRFAKGHRIRLQVSSGAHPRWLRNLGTGTPFVSETTMRVAEQTVYHDRAHPSMLVLPIV